MLQLEDELLAEGLNGAPASACLAEEPELVLLPAVALALAFRVSPAFAFLLLAGVET